MYMNEEKIVYRERLWASQKEIIEFLDNPISVLFDINDPKPICDFPIEEYSGKYGDLQSDVMSGFGKNPEPPNPGFIRIYSFWGNNCWVKISVIQSTTSTFSRREHLSGQVNLFQPLGCENQTDVEIVCGWSLFLPYWEWLARCLHKKFGKPIVLPIVAKVLLNKTHDEAVSYFNNKFTSISRLIFHGLVTTRGTKPDGLNYVFWTDVTPSVMANGVFVTIEPFGNETLITVYALNDTWSRLSWSWELLYDLMNQEQIVKIIIPWNNLGLTGKTLKKPGRKHKPDDEWAWNEINEKHRNADEVKKEWLDCEGVKSRNLVDPERQFKKIIRENWKTKS